ncbi:MAG: slr1658 superfamily regulator [Gemmatimonadaceae bacterium]
MNGPKVFGRFAPNGSSPRRDTPAEPPLSELSLSFPPLAFVAEWTRCSETADFVARFFSHDYEDREVAGNILSTVVNELVENAVKFSSDKAVPACLTVREYADRVTIVTANVVTAAQGAAFGDTVTRLVAGDPEILFAEQVAHPPQTGSAGIGLILLRKDYDATIGVRLAGGESGTDRAVTVDVEVTIENREVGQT